LFVLAAAVLWGTTGTAQALAPEGAQPAAIGAMRLAIGGIALLLLAGIRGALRSGVRWPALATAFAGGSMAAYQICFFTSVVKTVATALAVAGCSLLVAAGGSLSVDVLGIVLALGAGAAYATYAVASKGLLDERPPDAVMAVVFCLGAVLLAPLLFVADLSWLAQPRGLAVALHLGLVATAAAYALFARGLMAIPVAAAVTLSLAEPLTAGTLGVVLLGEQLTTSAVLGIGLIFGGLVLLSLGGRR
jgi:DME family drug/metabolite transporter